MINIFKQVVVFLLSTIYLLGTLYADENLDLLTQILQDAQEDNRSKFIGGEMSYRISSKINNSQTLVFEATVRWDKDTAFWIYKVSDPSSTVFDGVHNAPLNEIQTEYMLRDKNKIFSYNAYSHTLHELEFDKIQQNRMFVFFDVFPNSLGSHCCFPFQSSGRLWSDISGSNYLKLFPDSNMTIERIGKSIIRQKLTTSTGSIATSDFSMDHSGHPVRIEFIDNDVPTRSSISEFEWMKINNSTILKRFNIKRGDIRSNIEKIKELIDFEATSFKVIKSSFAFDFSALKALLPKNTTFVDHVSKKSYPLFPTAKTLPEIDENTFNRLGLELKKNGFAKP